MHQVAMILKEKMGDRAKKVPTKVMPNWLVRVAGLFNSTARTIVPQLGQIKNASSEKARTMLGWKPRTSEEAIVASAESLVRLGITKNSADQNP